MTKGQMLCINSTYTGRLKGIKFRVFLLIGTGFSHLWDESSGDVLQQCEYS
jgi:hypothetical protein